MRRAALLLLAFCLVLAAPAGAQQKGKLSVVAPPPAKSALRGGQAAAAPPAAEVLPLPAYGLSTAAARNPGQCRLACAQRYYFCLAADAADECPQTWGQCRAACDAPSPVRAAQAEFPG